MSIPDPSPKHLEVLRNQFGHSQFRPMQWKIIYAILEKRQDLCIVMATGYGKSLCYQYPPVFCDGLGIVISPLISLMQDQILSLKTSNIEACLLGSAQTEADSVASDLMNGKYRVLYITPEYCKEGGRSFLANLHQRVKITVVAIDEAHCVSQWGCDFRPDYRKLGLLREKLANVPFISLTATATPKVRLDICESLKLKNPEIICTDFDRPNLFLSVSLQSGQQSEYAAVDAMFNDFRKLMVKDGFNYKFEGSTIIYCSSRKKTEAVAEVLKRNGLKCEYYHAALSLPKRKEIHEKFVRDELNVIVATVAFGMGIDKPDVRFVIHYGAPKEIESYYQEVGRAGRDGLPARCHVFYKSADFAMNKHFFGNLTGEFRKHREKMAKLLENYLETNGCRRRLLLSYFQEIDEEVLNKNKKCCDNCCRSSSVLNRFKKHITVSLDEEAKLLLKAVKYFNGKSGIIKPIQFLRGSNNKNIQEYMKRSELYGKGKYETEIWWKALARILLRQDLLEERACEPFGGFKKGFKAFPITVVCITTDGETFIKKGSDGLGIKLEPTEELLKNMTTKPQPTYSNDQLKQPQGSVISKPVEIVNVSKPEAESNSESELKIQQRLYDALLKTRQNLAFEFHIMPYVVASNLALQGLCRNKPKKVEELTGIEGFNEAKIEKFGEAFVKTVNEVILSSASNSSTGTIESITCDIKTKLYTESLYNEISDAKEGIAEKGLNPVKSEKSSVQDFLNDDDDDIFENLDDTNATEFSFSDSAPKVPQNVEESTSPELLKPTKFLTKKEDLQTSAHFLDEDMDMFQDFDMLDELENEAVLSKASSSTSKDTTSPHLSSNTSVSSNKQVSNSIITVKSVDSINCNSLGGKKSVSETTSVIKPLKPVIRTGQVAATSSHVSKTNSNKKIKYDSYDSSDDDSPKSNNQDSSSWLFNSKAKSTMVQKMKKNTLFK